MGKSQKTNATAKQTTAKEPTRRGHQPGDKVLNRRGGGVPPVGTISSPARAEGVRKALMRKTEANLASAGQRTFDNYDDARRMIWPLSFMDLAPSVALIAALKRAAKDTPDWGRLPEGSLPGERFIKNHTPPTRRRQPQAAAKPIRTAVQAKPALSQIEKILGEATAIRAIPAVRRDLSGFAAVRAASIKANA